MLCNQSFRSAEFPGDDIAAVILQDGGQIIPAPANDLEVGKICLLHLVDSRGFVGELFGRFNHHIIGCCNQVSRFQNAVS